MAQMEDEGIVEDFELLMLLLDAWSFLNPEDLSQCYTLVQTYHAKTYSLLGQIFDGN